MNRLSNLLTAAGLGAGMMYFFDPVVGNRRRSLVRDQFNHLINKTGDAVDTTVRDMQNRLTGMMAEMRACVSDFSGEQPSDDVLVQRVRSTMGRYVSHASAIDVSADNGVVRLSGPILAREVPQLIHAVQSVRGVERVEHDLEEHQSAGNISALQGGRTATGSSIDLMQQNWSPTTRVLVGGAGAALMLRCLMRGGAMSVLLCPVALAMATRALANEELGDLLDAGSQGRTSTDFGGSQPQRRQTQSRSDRSAAADAAPQTLDVTGSAMG